MGPKQIAMVVLAVIAAIGLVITVIAGAVAALPRENRYVVGAQQGDNASTAPASPPSTSAPSSPSSPTVTPAPPETVGIEGVATSTRTSFPTRPQ